MLKVLPRLELGLEDSKSSVITNYTIRPLVYLFIFFNLFFRILLSYFKKPLARLELATPGLEVRCAIQLRQPGFALRVHAPCLSLRLRPPRVKDTTENANSK